MIILDVCLLFCFKPVQEEDHENSNFSGGGGRGRGGQWKSEDAEFLNCLFRNKEEGF